MDYLKQLNELRDELHKKIVYTAILLPNKNRELFVQISKLWSDGRLTAQLMLKNPLEAFQRRYKAGELRNLKTTNVFVTGIIQSTGELIAETASGTPERLYYSDLSLEQLAVLLKQIESRLFTIKTNSNA